MSTEDKKP